MLRNVAIPLMLAASEAEAAPTAAELKRAMAADREAEIPILIADAAACTAKSDATGVGAADALVTKNAGLLTTAKGALTKLQTGTGAWKLADDKRKKAVADAVAKEAETNVAGKLNTLDANAELERKAAAAYFQAKRAFDTGTALVVSTKATEAITNQAETDTKALHTAAAQAVVDTTNAITEEQNTLKWLYCELGSIPAVPTCTTGDAPCASRKKAYEDAKTAGSITNWWNGFGTAGVTDPKKCLVPAVLNSSSVAVRASTTYYTTKGSSTDQLPAETVDKKFNRTLAVAEANIALATTESTTATGTSRHPDGDVAWLEGNAVRFQWLVQQRTREAEFYKYVNAQIVLAKGWATKYSSDNTYVVPGATTTEYKHFRMQMFDKKTGGDTAGATRYAAGNPSASKLLDTAKTARDVVTQSTGGSGNKMGGVKRAQETSPAYRGYVTNWTRHTSDTAGVTGTAAWVTMQHGYTTKAKQYSWWLLARAASLSNKNWNTAMYMQTTATDSEYGSAVDNKTMLSAPVAYNNQTGAPADAACDETTGAKCTDCAWVAKVSNVAGTIDDATKCFTACQEYNVSTDGIGEEYTNAAGHSNSGKYYAPRRVAGAKICMGASYTTSGPVCKLFTVAPDKLIAGMNTGIGSQMLTGKVLPIVATAGGKCQTVIKKDTTKVPKDTNATMARWAQLWDDWYNKYKLAIAGTTVYDEMVADATAQAELEKKWLNAWYFQQFWAKMAVQLTTTTAGARAKDFTDWYGGANGANAPDTKLSSKAGSTAKQTENTTKLENARNKLAVLTTKHEAAKTAKALVETQILNGTEQIADMQASIKSRTGAGQTLVLGGELAELATKRKADWDFYGVVTTGKKAVDTAARAAAEAAVAVGTPTTSSAGAVTWANEGALKKDQRVKKEAWDAAKAATKAARTAVGTQVDSTGASTLAKLRAAVKTATTEWDTQQTELDKAIGAVAAAEGELLKAQKALASTIQSCQTKAFDKYKATLDAAIAARKTKLDTIETLLKGQTTPAPGTIGARCEKALSNGTFRKARDEFGGCGTGNCCGAARVWMNVGVETTEDVAWRTIETCQKADAKTYDYQPPRAPLATVMPAVKSVDFACIEGAKTLAAAASAVAAAVYMLA